MAFKLNPTTLEPDYFGGFDYYDDRYLRVDQSTPQTVTGGVPVFYAGIAAGNSSSDANSSVLAWGGYTTGLTSGIYTYRAPGIPSPYTEIHFMHGGDEFFNLHYTYMHINYISFLQPCRFDDAITLGAGSAADYDILKVSEGSATSPKLYWDEDVYGLSQSGFTFKQTGEDANLACVSTSDNCAIAVWCDSVDKSSTLVLGGGSPNVLMNGIFWTLNYNGSTDDSFSIEYLSPSTGYLIPFTITGSINPEFKFSGYITASSSQDSFSLKLDDTDDYVHITRGSTNVLGTNIDMPVNVNPSADSSFIFDDVTLDIEGASITFPFLRGIATITLGETSEQAYILALDAGTAFYQSDPEETQVQISFLSSDLANQSSISYDWGDPDNRYFEIPENIYVGGDIYPSGSPNYLGRSTAPWTGVYASALNVNNIAPLSGDTIRVSPSANSYFELTEKVIVIDEGEEPIELSLPYITGSYVLGEETGEILALCPNVGIYQHDAEGTKCRISFLSSDLAHQSSISWDWGTPDDTYFEIPENIYVGGDIYPSGSPNYLGRSTSPWTGVYASALNLSAKASVTVDDDEIQLNVGSTPSKILFSVLDFGIAGSLPAISFYSPDFIGGTTYGAINDSPLFLYGDTVHPQIIFYEDGFNSNIGYSAAVDALEFSNDNSKFLFKGSDGTIQLAFDGENGGSLSWVDYTTTLEFLGGDFSIGASDITNNPTQYWYGYITSAETAKYFSMSLINTGYLVFGREDAAVLGIYANMPLYGFTTLQSDGASALYNSIYNFYRASTTDALNFGGRFEVKQESGGGSSAIPFACVATANVTGGTFNHAGGFLGWITLDGSSVAGHYLPVEGRCDNGKVGSTGYGVVGRTTLTASDNTGSTNYAGQFWAETTAGGGTGVNIGVQTFAVGAATNYDLLIGRGTSSGENGITSFRGYITDGAGMGNVDFSVDDVFDQFLVNLSNAKIDGLLFYLRDAAGASSIDVWSSTPAKVFSVTSAGLVDWSAGSMKPKVYTQSTEPDTANDTMAFWKDSDDNKYYLILDIGGTQKKVELT